MGFKRPRPLHYNVHPGQMILQNGVAQPSPLDRKALALEGQKKLALSLSSADRDAWNKIEQDFTSLPTDCIIRLSDTVRGVYGYRVMEFLFRNLIYNVVKGVTDTLQVVYADMKAPTVGHNPDATTNTIAVATDPVLIGKIVIPQGMYTAVWEPSKAYQVSINRTLNNIVIADVALWMAFSNDIRVALLIAAKGVISAITTDPSTGFVTITWTGENPTIVYPNSPVAGAPTGSGSNIVTLLSFPLGSTGNTFTTKHAVNTTTPETMGIRSPLLNNSEVLDPDGDNEFFIHIPILADYGEKQMYAPKVPSFVNFNSQQTISRIEFKFYDHESGLPLTAPDMEWNMLLELYTIDPTPAT